jgi:hypothetical protein
MYVVYQRLEIGGKYICDFRIRDCNRIGDAKKRKNEKKQYEGLYYA